MAVQHAAEDQDARYGRVVLGTARRSTRSRRSGTSTPWASTPRVCAATFRPKRRPRALFSNAFFVDSAVSLPSGVLDGQLHRRLELAATCTRKGILGTNDPGNLAFNSSGGGGTAQQNCTDAVCYGASNIWTYPVDGCVGYHDPEHARRVPPAVRPAEQVPAAPVHGDLDAEVLDPECQRSNRHDVRDAILLGRKRRPVVAGGAVRRDPPHPRRQRAITSRRSRCFPAARSTPPTAPRSSTRTGASISGSKTVARPATGTRA